MFESLNIEITPTSTWQITTPLPYTKKLPFYLLEWGHFIAMKNYYTAREHSNRYLLFYTLSGKGKLVYDGDTYILEPHTIAIIHCNAPHRYETFSEDPWDFLWFHYNGSAADAYYSIYNDDNLYLHKILYSGQEANLINKIISCSTRYDLEKDLNVNKWITDLMTLFIIAKRKKMQQYAPTITEKLNTAIQFMTDHLTEKISVSDIAQSVYLSPYHFLRIFKKQLGSTPYEYLIHLRIDRAKSLLVSTDSCLEDIAVSSGFSDSKNLIYNFKRKEHLTPNEYRKEFSVPSN